MAQVTMRGNPVNTNGEVPAAGSSAPEFTLTKGDLSSMSSGDFVGTNVILNIFPSVDTPTCATSVRTVNERAAGLDNTTIVCVSADLPFAQGRFCGAEGIENVVMGSTFRNPEFLTDYGVLFTDGMLAGLAARAVVVIDGTGNVIHSELVGEVANEPDYDAALNAIG